MCVLCCRELKLQSGDWFYRHIQSRFSKNTDLPETSPGSYWHTIQFFQIDLACNACIEGFVWHPANTDIYVRLKLISNICKNSFDTSQITQSVSIINTRQRMQFRKLFSMYCDSHTTRHSSQYLKGPVTGHLDTGLSWFPLCLLANAEMVPKIPSCHYMLLM